MITPFKISDYWCKLGLETSHGGARGSRRALKMLRSWGSWCFDTASVLRGDKNNTLSLVRLVFLAAGAECWCRNTDASHLYWFLNICYQSGFCLFACISTAWRPACRISYPQISCFNSHFLVKDVKLVLLNGWNEYLIQLIFRCVNVTQNSVLQHQQPLIWNTVKFLASRWPLWSI